MMFSVCLYLFFKVKTVNQVSKSIPILRSVSFLAKGLVYPSEPTLTQRLGSRMLIFLHCLAFVFIDLIKNCEAFLYL